MKRATTYLLLFVYSIALLKPISPIVNDFISHTFWKMEHMATVHFENGKYHLHNELSAAGNEDHSTKKQGTISPDELSLHITSLTTFQFTDNKGSTSAFRSITSSLVYYLLEKDSPPPRS